MTAHQSSFIHHVQTASTGGPKASVSRVKTENQAELINIQVLSSLAYLALQLRKPFSNDPVKDTSVNVCLSG